MLSVGHKAADFIVRPFLALIFPPFRPHELTPRLDKWLVLFFYPLYVPFYVALHRLMVR